MIDGIDGYRTMFPHDHGTDAYERRLNPLTTYLQRQGVTTILTSEVRDITGNFQATDHPVSYLGDNLVFLRYLESNGELQRAIGVLETARDRLRANATHVQDYSEWVECRRVTYRVARDT